MRQKLNVLVLFLVLLGLSTTATANWVDLGSKQPQKPLISASDAGRSVTLEIELPGYDLSTVTIDGSSYTKIMVPGQAPRMVRGYPELPFVDASVLIPGTGTPAFKIIDETWVEIAVDPVRPSKGHFSRDLDPSTVSYVFADLYERGGQWPSETAVLGDPFIVRDLRGVNLQLNAFQYDASRGVLRVLQRAVIEITTSGVGDNEKVSVARAHNPEFQRIYRGLFANYGADKYVPISHPGRMLIVVDDALQGAMAPFVEWKLQRGIQVEMITTSSVGGSVAGIQTAITTRYNADGLTYVILVGDIAQIPTHIGTSEGNGSDATFAMVDGSDLYADLFVSRISATNPTAVQTQINKFIRYERDPDLGAAGDWYSKGAGLASNEGSPSDLQRADWVRDDLLAYGFTDVDQIYQPTGTTTNILNALADGRSVMYYIGHGSGTSWSNPAFSNGNVPSLNNNWMQPWVIDVSCSNGTTTLNPCLAEAMMGAGTTVQPQGAIGMFSSWGTCAWVPPTVMMDEAIDLFVAETTSTLGALYFYGAMKTLDDYPGTNGEGHKLVEQYQIFGDCSLMVRSFAPTAIAPVHLASVFLNSPTFDVSVPGEPGATVTLYRNGVLHGSAVTDVSGNAVITLDVPVSTPGDMTLTVSGFNLDTYIATLPTANASNVSIAPASIDANVMTNVTVTVLDGDGVTPLPGIDVWAGGIGYATTPVATDAAGQAVLSLLYPYGPSIEIAGQDPAETFELFRETLPVNAATLVGADLSVTTTFGMSDQFGLSLMGTLVATVSEAGHTLSATLPGGSEFSTGDFTLDLTPVMLSQVHGMIAVPGYDIYTESFDVVEAFGTLSGTVLAGGSGAVGASVRGLDGLSNEVFTAVCGVGGSYAVSGDIPVDSYTLEIDFFGYLSHSAAIVVDFGTNTEDVTLAAAPFGVLSGIVTDLAGGLPVAADVKIYRTDDGSLYAHVVSDAGDGSYSAPLPYFDYEARISATGFVPVVVGITIDQPAVAKNFQLEETSGNILVLDDGGAARVVSSKYSEKGSTFLAGPYLAAVDRSGIVFESELIGLGYSVTLESFATSNAATWSTYDFIVVACGGNTTPVDSATQRSALVAYCQAGGHLLLEGGEVAYTHNSDADFKNDVMHITSWDGDSSGSVTVADPGHALMSNPVAITGPIAVTYNGYGDHDRVSVAAGAVMPGNWSSYASNASIVVFDPNSAPMGGQIVFMTFNIDATDAAGRSSLIQNAATYLLMSELGDASVSGFVTLAGSADHSGVLVEAVPGGGTTITSVDGSYSLTDLFPGSYTIRAAKAFWSSATVDVTLNSGDALTGVNMGLGPISEYTLCSTPGLAIPDNSAGGVNDQMTMSLGAGITVSDLEVFVDISHTWQGDLIVSLMSPAGTSVVLHNRTGSGTDNIFGWYPGDLSPAGNLADFVGEDMDGIWTLTVSDHAGSDTGTLDEWCLKITYNDPSTGIEDGMPAMFALGANYPNPFNPSTTIRFAVPRDGRVMLEVYDLAGRVVRRLVDETLVADSYSVTWQGRDETGRQVASGTYYYRLTADGERSTRKMTLLK